MHLGIGLLGRRRLRKRQRRLSNAHRTLGRELLDDCQLAEPQLRERAARSNMRIGGAVLGCRRLRQWWPSPDTGRKVARSCDVAIGCGLARSLKALVSRMTRDSRTLHRRFLSYRKFVDQHFIGAHDEALSVATVRVNNPDCSPVAATQPQLHPCLLRLSATTLSTSARRIPSLRQRVQESNPIALHTKFRGRCLFAAYFLGAGTGKSIQRAASLNFPGFLKLDKSDKQLL